MTIPIIAPEKGGIMIIPIEIANFIIGFCYGLFSVFSIILHLINLVLPIPVIPVLNFDINQWDVYNVGRHSLAYASGFVLGVTSFVIAIYESRDY